MADKYTKVEPKISPITIISIIAFFVISISLIFILQPSNEALIYAAYEKTATSDFTEDHPYYQVTYDGSLFKKGLDTIIEKDEIVALYIGSPDCPSCQQHIGAFQKYYESENFSDYVSKIYYLNPIEDSQGMTELTSQFEEVLTVTPQFIIFQNGEVLATFEPESAEDTILINRSVRDFYEDVILAINAN